MTLPEQMTLRPLGFPLASWAFAVRTWLAAILALYVCFSLSIEMPSMAMITVAIIAEPTRGQALDKAVFRAIATIIGVVASIVITGLFSQTRDLMLTAYAGWMGLCVYVAGLLDGNRAYAAVLSGVTVALVSIQDIDNPGHVFESGLMRGAGILVGIASLAIVNDLLLAPDRHKKLVGQLSDVHRRVIDHAKSAILGETTQPMESAALLAEISSLRPELSGLVFESSSGPARRAASQNVAAALVAQLHAARSLGVLPVTADRATSERIVRALERDESTPTATTALWSRNPQSQTDTTASLEWALREVLRRDRQVRQNLDALRTGEPPSCHWRGLIYRSRRAAVEGAIQAAIWVVLAELFLVCTGWPRTNASLALIGAFVGLGAITPNSRATTSLALIAAPIGGVLAGLAEFVVLDGADDFPLLAIGLAPLVIGAALLISLPNRVVAALGRFILIYAAIIFPPVNPQTYGGESYVIFSLLACLAPSLLLAAQFLVPPVSPEQRRRWMVSSARDDAFRRPAGDRQPEEEMFRDAGRIGQILSTGGNAPDSSATIEAVLSHFDQSSIVRLCDFQLRNFAGGPSKALVEEMRAALDKREPKALRTVSRFLRKTLPSDGSMADLSAALIVASYHIEASPRRPVDPGEVA